MSTLRERGAALRPHDPAAIAAGTLLGVVMAAGFAVTAYLLSPFAAPLALAALLFVVVTFLRPAWGVGGALLMTPLELVNLELLGAAVSPTDATFALVAVAWFSRALIHPGSVAKPTQRDLPVMVLLAIVALGLTVAQDPEPVLRVLTTWTFFYVAYLQAQTFTPLEMKGVLIAFALAAGILGTIGTIDYLRAADTGLLEGGNTTQARAAGALEDPNAYAALLVLALLPAIALLIADARRNAWLTAVIAAALAGLVFSLSRGAISAFVAGMLLMLLWRRVRWAGAGLAAILAILTIANANPLAGSEELEVVGERLSTLSSDQLEVNDRPRIWATAVDAAVEHPLIGVGMNQFQYEAARDGLTQRGMPLENAHSVPLSLAAETGLIGLAAFLVFVGQLALRGVRSLKRPAPHPLAFPISLGLVAALLAFLLQSLTLVQLRTPVLAAGFFVFAGMLTALADRSRTETRA